MLLVDLEESAHSQRASPENAAVKQLCRQKWLLTWEVTASSQSCVLWGKVLCLLCLSFLTYNMGMIISPLFPYSVCED